MAEYDGWTIKSCISRNPFLLVWHFREKRIDVIKEFNKITGGSWRKWRRRGDFKLVKVKLMEVK